MIVARDKQNDNTFGDKIDVPRGLQLCAVRVLLLRPRARRGTARHADVPDSALLEPPAVSHAVVQRRTTSPGPRASTRRRCTSAPTAAFHVVVAHAIPAWRTGSTPRVACEGAGELPVLLGDPAPHPRRRGGAASTTSARSFPTMRGRSTPYSVRTSCEPAATTSPGASAPEPPVDRLSRLTGAWTSNSPPSNSPSATRSRRSSTRTTTPCSSTSPARTWRRSPTRPSAARSCARSPSRAGSASRGPRSGAARKATASTSTCSTRRSPRAAARRSARASASSARRSCVTAARR